MWTPLKRAGTQIRLPLSRQLGLGLAVLAAAMLMLGGCQPETGRSSPPLPSQSPAPTSDDEAWPQTFPNTHGPDIELAGPALNIVTMQPNIAEMLCAIGATSHVAAVDRYTDYPPEMLRKPKIGDILTPDYEKIVSMQPDLIITSRGTAAEVLQKLRDLGMQVLGVDPQSLGDVFSCMKMLGRLTGNAQVAADIVAQLQRRRQAAVAKAQAAVDKQGRPRTVFVLQLDPLFVAGKSSFIASLIEDAGGKQVIAATVAGADQPWPQVSQETVLAASPEVLIFPSAQVGEERADSPERLLAQLRQQAAWAQLPAVSNGRVYVIDDDLITIPGPRLLRALEQMVDLLHPPSSATEQTSPGNGAE